MARQKGILKIQGTVDDLTFYKTKDGNLVKSKSSIPKERIANDPAFQRTRENGSEFGMAANAGKLIRDALRNLLINAADGRITSRLTKVLMQVKDYDTTSIRGLRNVAAGILDASAKSLMIGFNFNDKAILGAILFKPYTLNTSNGVFGISGLIQVNDIAFPQGATHATLRSAWAKVDFNGKIFETVLGTPKNVPLNSASVNVNLSMGSAPTMTSGTNFFVLMIEFFQEVNGVQYSLRNGAYNALAIVEITD